jgi:L-amino acid N-acyltransferase YncA
LCWKAKFGVENLVRDRVVTAFPNSPKKWGTHHKVSHSERSTSKLEGGGVMSIRRAKLEDATQIHAIFKYYVLHSVSTYHHTPPPIHLFLRKIHRSITSSRFPFFVAIDDDNDDTILGYAYGSEYRDHAGYQNTIENSIFIHHDYQKRGLGRLLLGALVEECRRLEYRVMVAILGAGKELLPGTWVLHEGIGFREVGRLVGVGEKFGMILDTPILQLDLTTTTANSIVKREDSTGAH